MGLKSTKLTNVYNYGFLFLAVVSVILTILDIQGKLSPVWIILDSLINLIFVVDYAVRLVTAENKKHFFKSNIFDLIAILPFNTALQLFRTARLLKLLKILKLVKLGGVSSRVLAKSKKFLDTNGIKYVFGFSLITVMIGACSIMYFEKMDFADSLWWSFVNATTVGYGDLSPVTIGGRITASLLMLVGIGLIGSLTSAITSFFLASHNTTKLSDNSVDIDKVEMVQSVFQKLNEAEKLYFLNSVQDLDQGHIF